MPCLRAHVQGETTSENPLILRLMPLCRSLFPTRVPDGNPDVDEEGCAEKDELGVEDRDGADNE